MWDTDVLRMDQGVRAYMQQSRIFVGMVLILIFGEVLGLYGYVSLNRESYVGYMLTRHLQLDRGLDIEYQESGLSGFKRSYSYSWYIISSAPGWSGPFLWFLSSKVKEHWRRFVVV